MKNIALAITIIFFASALHAASRQEIKAAVSRGAELEAQRLQQLVHQREALKPRKAPTGMDLTKLDLTKLDLASFSLQDSQGKCFELVQLQVSGATLLDEWEVGVFELPFLGKCITHELVSNVLAEATDFYVSRGFITTRIYLPDQDLNEGTLNIRVAEGHVEDVVVVQDESLNFVTIYLNDSDQLFTVRDLEQAVDQLNEIPGNDVFVTVEPGLLPQTSRVVFENRGKSGIKGYLSIDNAGNEDTGQVSVGVALKAGNLLQLGDVWSLRARKSLSPSDRDSNNYGLHVRVPRGYNTYGAGVSKGHYDAIFSFPVTGTQLSAEGAYRRGYLLADRVVFRDQRSKHSIGLKLLRDSTESYISDIRVDVASRSISSLEMSAESLLGFGQSVLVVKPQIAVGLSEADNFPEAVNPPVDNPQSEFLRYRLTLDWCQPISLDGHALRWQSKLRMQQADEPLYASQQLIVGGADSVRGFHDISVSGDSGFYWQNSLYLNNQFSLADRAINTEYMIGYDFGAVSSVRSGVYEGQLQGAIIGAVFTFAPWRFEINHTIPLSIEGGRDKGDSYTTAIIGLGF